ncbi:MAG: AMP-binding protein [Planctomycetota bacterium]
MTFGGKETRTRNAYYNTFIQPATSCHVTIPMLTDALKRHSATRPNDLALWWSESDGEVLGQPTNRFLCWRELDAITQFIAVRLQGLDRSLEKPFAHTTQGTPHDVLFALACYRAGAIEVPIDSAGGSQYINACRKVVESHWISDSTKAAWIGESSLEPNLPETIGRETIQRSPQSDALILFTSGTSGPAKGVVLSHQSLLLNAKAKLKALPQSRQSRRLAVLSIAHSYARTCDLGTWLISGCVLAIGRGFDGWERLAKRIQPTHCNTVPSLASRLMQQVERIPSLQYLGCGGAALSSEAYAAFRSRGIVPIQGYGLTEAAPVIASQTPRDSIPGRCGQIVDGWESRLSDTGQLFVRGKHQMSRYWMRPDETSRRIDEDGWLDTGDVVSTCPASGQIKVLGRADDRITLANGHCVDPLPIETTAKQTRGVDHALLDFRADQRSLLLWVLRNPMSRQETIDGQGLLTNLNEFPAWSRPSEIRQVTFSTTQQRQFCNHKGVLRRKPTLTWLRSLPASDWTRISVPPPPGTFAS